jgi:hypothetical protein
VGSIYNRGLAAAVCLNIAITVTTTIKRAVQNNVILSPQTTEERTTMRRALPRRPKHERVWRAYPRCRTAEEMSTMSQPVPAHPCSHPPAETKPVAEVVVRGYSASVVDIAMLVRRRAVCTATLNTARMMLSSRRHASAVRGPLAATLREGLGDRLDARGASAALPIRHRPSKDTSRWREPLPQRLRNFGSMCHSATTRSKALEK